MEKIRLRNGFEIPQIGMGTWQITDKGVMEKLLVCAYKTDRKSVV